jgi:fructose-1,6-bisphosphatase II
MPVKQNRPPLEQHFVMDLVRVTEAAALSAGRFMGMGDKNLVDRAAVDAMRSTLSNMEMNGVVVIGEGEKDEAPMLFIGERIGAAEAPRVDIAVDPVDGTTLCSKGLPGAISAIAVSARGTMNAPREVVYMDKIAVGREAKDAIDINASVAQNLANIAKAKGRKVQDLTVVVLDRPRHDQLLSEIRAAGARVRLISDGDVAAAIHAAMPASAIDILMGVGGTPEAVLAAAAIRCIGGAIQTKLWPRDDKERQRALEAGLDLNRVYHTDDLVGGEDVFFAATGVTGGDLLKGVRYLGNGAESQSIVLRSRSGTIRWVNTTHDFTRLDKIGSYGAGFNDH